MWDTVYDNPEHRKSKDITEMIKVMVSQLSYYQFYLFKYNLHKIPLIHQLQ